MGAELYLAKSVPKIFIVIMTTFVSVSSSSVLHDDILGSILYILKNFLVKNSLMSTEHNFLECTYLMAKLAVII